MNNFTKTELQIILLAMDINIRRCTILTVAESYKALRDKVESMIDNYCDQHYADKRAYDLPQLKNCFLCDALNVVKLF